MAVDAVEMPSHRADSLSQAISDSRPKDSVMGPGTPDGMVSSCLRTWRSHPQA